MTPLLSSLSKTHLDMLIEELQKYQKNLGFLRRKYASRSQLLQECLDESTIFNAVEKLDSIQHIISKEYSILSNQRDKILEGST